MMCTIVRTTVESLENDMRTHSWAIESGDSP